MFLLAIFFIFSIHLCTSTPSSCRTSTPSSCRTSTPSSCRTSTPSSCRTNTPSSCRTSTPSSCRTSTPSSCRTSTPSSCRTSINERYCLLLQVCNSSFLILVHWTNIAAQQSVPSEIFHFVQFISFRSGLNIVWYEIHECRA